MSNSIAGSLIGFRRNGQPIYLIGGGSEGATEQPIQNDSQGQTDTGVVEPAEQKAPWSSYLEDLPESVRPLVEPKFKEWDSNVTQQFQKVHSDYAPYKAYEPIVQAGHDPELVLQAIQFAEAFQENPEAVYKAMQEAYGFGGEQGQGTSSEQVPETEDDQYDPRFLELEQTTQTLAQIMAAQYEEEQAQQLDQALDDEITAAKEKHGDFDETVVLGWCAANPQLSIEQAAVRYNQAIEAAVAKRQAPNVPTIMGGGGSLPSQAIDPAKLTRSDTKSLVAQYLEAANREG